MNTSDSFDLRELTYTQYLFTQGEQAKLLKYGAWAVALDQGIKIPSTERQNHFVAVCRGEMEPQTDFEFLWSRYKEAVRVNQMLSVLTEDVSRYRHDADTLRKSLFAEIEKAKIGTEELNNLIKKLQAKISSYERKLGINQPEPKDPSKKYSSNVDEWREQP